jgi:hypothetical protein
VFAVEPEGDAGRFEARHQFKRRPDPSISYHGFTSPDGLGVAEEGLKSRG